MLRPTIRVIAHDAATGVTLHYVQVAEGNEYIVECLDGFRRHFLIGDARCTRDAFFAFADAVACYRETRAAELDRQIRNELSSLDFAL